MTNTISGVLHTDDWRGLALVAAGIVISCLSYASFQPAIITLTLLLVGWGLLSLPVIGGAAERRAFFLVFAAGTLWAGIAAVFANQLADFGQNHSDPAFFFAVAADWNSSLNVYAANDILESTGAVVLWNRAYDLAQALGLAPGRYIGIGVNGLLVGLAAALAIKSARSMYGDDWWRLRLLAWLLAACPMFWLFSSIFLREAFILLFVVSLGWLWVRLLARFSTSNLAVVGVASVLALYGFIYLRAEFVIVPIAMGFAGGTALLLAPNVESRPLLRRTVGLFICIVAAFTSAFVLRDTFVSLSEASARYADLAVKDLMAAGGALDGMIEDQVSQSLGMKLVVGQPLYVRAVLAPVYLWLAPIPIWAGFTLSSAYFLMKSLHTVFNYFLIAALLVVGWRLLRGYRSIEPVQIYLVLCTLGFSLSVAITSLESRHLGVFLTLPLLLVTGPDWRLPANRLALRNTSIAVLSVMVLIHLAWFAIKAVS